jgi:uncharacterized protein YjbJ (UPF0337 family)
MPFNAESIVKARVMSKASNFVNGSVGNVTGAVSGAVGAATGAVSGAVSGAVGAATGAVSGALGAATGAAGSALDKLKNVSNVKELVGAKIGMLKEMASGSKPQILNGLKSGADSFVKSVDPGSVIPAQINSKVTSLESSVSTLNSQVASLLPPV